jgi:hypothetical protein
MLPQITFGFIEGENTTLKTKETMLLYECTFRNQFTVSLQEKLRYTPHTTQCAPPARRLSVLVRLR